MSDGRGGTVTVQETVPLGGSGDLSSRARFAAINWQHVAIALDWLAIRFSSGDNLYTVQGSQLTVDSDYAQPHSDWFPTDTAGTLTVASLWHRLQNDL